MADREHVERFENSPDLFGAGGSGTTNGLTCEWCGTEYPARDEDDDSRCYTHFAGKQVCDCCFGEIEQAVLSRMEDILPWFTRLLEARRAKLAGNDEAVDALIRMADGVVAARTPAEKPPRS